MAEKINIGNQYERTDWNVGDIIGAEDLNHLEKRAAYNVVSQWNMPGKPNAHGTEASTEETDKNDFNELWVRTDPPSDATTAQKKAAWNNDTDPYQTFEVPEIDDENVSETDTWSSQHIVETFARNDVKNDDATSPITAFTEIQKDNIAYNSGTVRDRYLAPLFSASSSYDVGDYVMYNNKLYRCITAIETGGSWSTYSSRFTEVSMGNEVSGLKSDLTTDLNNLSGEIRNINELSFHTPEVTWESGTISTTSGKTSSSTYYIRTLPLSVRATDKINVKNIGSVNYYYYVFAYTNNSFVLLKNRVALNPGVETDVDIPNDTKTIKLVIRYTSSYTDIDVSQGTNVRISLSSSLLNAIEDLTTNDINTANSINSLINLTDTSLQIPSFEQGTININNGNAVASDYYIRTTFNNPLNVSNLDTINFLYSSTQNQTIRFYVFNYDENDNYLNTYTRIDLITDFPVSISTASATFIRLGLHFTNTEEGPVNIYPAEGDNLSASYSNKIQNVINNIPNNINNKFIKNNLASIFHKFAVVGDSLSAGRVYLESTYPSGIDRKILSWPIMLARELNNSVYNCSIHGQSPDTFIKGYLYDTDPSSTSCGVNQKSVLLDGNHDVPLIIIALGVNNHNNLTMGTAADINLTDPSSSGNTRHGWFGRMLLEIGEYYDTNNKNTNILIIQPAFLPTGSSHGATVSNLIQNVYDKVADTIEDAGYVKISLLDTRRYSEAFSLDCLSNAVNHNHWTAIGYRALANIIQLCLNDWIDENVESLKTIEFIDSNNYITEYNYPNEFM